jgi:hypothetical protein
MNKRYQIVGPIQYQKSQQDQALLIIKGIIAKDERNKIDILLLEEMKNVLVIDTGLARRLLIVVDIDLARRLGIVIAIVKVIVINLRVIIIEIVIGLLLKHHRVTDKKKKGTKGY